MRTFAIFAISVVALACALFVTNINAKKTDAGDNMSVEFFEAFNIFMCSTGSKFCYEAPAQSEVERSAGISFPDLRNKMVGRILEWAGEMVRPHRATHLAMRAALPESLQKLFRLAGEMYSDEGKSPVDHQLHAAKALREALSKIEGTAVEDNEYPFFQWFPQVVGSVMASGGPNSTANFDTHCFGNVRVSAAQAGSKVTVHTEATHNAFLCDDVLLFHPGPAAIHLQILSNDKPEDFSFDTSAFTVQEKWYLKTNGIKVFRMPKHLLATVVSIVDTVVMLAGFAEEGTELKPTFEANLKFLNNYVKYAPDMQPKTVLRGGGDTVARDKSLESMIQSGDGGAVIRLDGVDPMLGWGSGTSVGHCVMFIRNASGHLFITESTVNDSYWKIGNGIEIHPYDEWIDAIQATTGPMNVLWVPLAPEYRKKFDEEKAWAYFKAHEGVNYGYVNFLFGWIDNHRNNFPCVPPDFKTCLVPDAVELLAIAIDRLQGPVNNNMFRQSMNFRAGLMEQNQPVLNTIYHAGTTKGMTFPDMYEVVESDSWLYNMSLNNGGTVRSVASVCGVWVCRMWKAAGIFSEIDDEVQCAEAGPFDIWAINIFDDNLLGNNRPEICKKTDPEGDACQLTGRVTHYVKPVLNGRKMAKNMWERCPSVGPEYPRPPFC